MSVQLSHVRACADSDLSAEANYDACLVDSRKRLAAIIQSRLREYSVSRASARVAHMLTRGRMDSHRRRKPRPDGGDVLHEDARRGAKGDIQV